MVAQLFSRASKSTIDLNPHIFGTSAGASSNTAIAERPQRDCEMNETEASFALILETMRHRGEIARWVYEGMTLRWADMKYTPDFIVFEKTDSTMRDSYEFITRMKMIEVKGAKIWDRDIVRFKGARAYWPEFAFEMHQRKRGEWARLY
jgi:hypothetical protein